MRSRPRVRLLALLFVAGCSLARETPEMRYYTLAVGDLPEARLESAVEVRSFTADDPYDTSRIAYRTSPYRIDYYTYHRWAAEPRKVVASAIRDALENSAGEAEPPYVISGHLRRLEEVDHESGWNAVLDLAIRVRRGGETLLERSYLETEPASERNPEAIAAAASRALGRILEKVLGDLSR